MKITTTQLAEWLDQYSGGCRICSVTMLTPLPMLVKSRVTKTPNPYLFDGESTIDHLQERLVFCGAKYAKMVQKAWEKTLNPDADGYIPSFVAAALWGGKGIDLNDYIVQHSDTKNLYLRLLYARTKDREELQWVDKSLKQEAWLDRITGLPIEPNWDELAQYLKAKSEPSKKQGCRDGADVETDIDGVPYRIFGGENSKEIMVRMPHLENVISIRSFDLKQRGKFETIELKRSKYQISI